MLFDEAIRDARFGLRVLRDSPGFTAVALLTLALGIGASTAVFSVVSGVLLNPLPWPDTARLVDLSDENLFQDLRTQPVTLARYTDWRDHTRVFEALLGYRIRGLTLVEEGTADLVTGCDTAPEAFSALDLDVELGRALLPSDAEPDAPSVAVIGHGLWERRFGADADVIGRRVTVDGVPVRIVGVLESGTWFPTAEVEVLLPLSRKLDAARVDRSLLVFGLLKEGATREVAAAELRLVNTRLAEAYPETDGGWTTKVVWASERAVGGRQRTSITALAGVVGVTLLFACLNISNLLLVRGFARRGEIVIRQAVGAARARIVRQLLVESLMLGLLALPVGVVMSHWLIDYFLADLPARIGWVRGVFRIDAPVMAFAVVLSLVTVLLAGIFPALRASRVSLSEDLKSEAQRGTVGLAGRLREGIAVVQLGLALMLLIGNVMMTQTFNQIREVGLGFESDNVIVTPIALPAAQYPSPGHWKSFDRELRSQVSRLPGVQDVGTIDFAPAGIGWPAPAARISVRNRPVLSEERAPRAGIVRVSSGYLGTLKIPLLQGRDFTEQDDRETDPVAVINASAARALFGASNPIGEFLEIDASESGLAAGGPRDGLRIVGVVGDVEQFGASGAGNLRVYLSAMQHPRSFSWLVARTRGDEISYAQRLRSAVSLVDPRLGLMQISTMNQEIETRRWSTRFFASVMNTLGLLTLVLSTVGVYGVISYSATLRRREFGLRAAIGGSPIQIAREVLRHASLLSALGICVGLAGALFYSRLLASVILRLTSFDMVTFVFTALLLAAAVLIASTVPALRAANADPADALRGE